MSRERWSVPPRQIAPVALVLALTIVGFFGARLLGERDARRDSEHRAEVAAAQIRGRVEQGAALADGLRRYMVGVAGRGVTDDEFAANASRWLSPAGFPAAAWVEQVPAARRAAYERRIGHPIVTRNRRGRIVPVGSRSSYLPATLVSRIPPMAVAGIDFGGEPGVPAALARARKRFDAGATPLTTLPDGSDGLFLIRLAPRLAGGVVKPGFVVVFVPELWLRAAATDTDTATLQLTVGGGSTGHPEGVHAAFSAAGQRFDVVVPRRRVQGAAAVLPWIILAAGLALAALAAALGVNAARRVRAQGELDRIFRLSPDVIAVADFDGRFTRVNPAAEQVLGYTEDELLARPFLDFVHPDDRERTAAETAALGKGKPTLSFQNRYVGKDGSTRALEWTATPVVEDRAMYAVARDVTERRRAEAELARLAGEQAALRRVATLVARGVPAAEVFSAVAEEVARLLDAQSTTIGRLEPDGTTVVVASSGDATGTRRTLEVPITVEGSVWGSITAGTRRDEFPPDAEHRMAEFTELAATAIANAEGRSALTASRARVVAASDATRRQIERDLHDGAQQRLVHTVITLKLARRALEAGDDEAVPALVAEALEHAERANVELRELVQGILPPVLTRGGLPPAVEALADRMPVPVDLSIDVKRLPPAVEATAYFVVAEALTNVAKHSAATHVAVDAHIEDGMLQIRVLDDGVGGARPEGHGFVGLADRLAVLDGQLRVESPAGGGTLVSAGIALHDATPAATGSPRAS